MPALHEILPVSPDVVERYQVLSPEASSEIVEEIAVAGTFKVVREISSLRVMQQADGQQFVTRDYSQRRLDSIGNKVGVDFKEAWDIMHEMYGRADIEVIPSFIVDHGAGSKDKRLTVVSEYLDKATPLVKAAIQPKRELAFKLGMLMYDSRRYSPALESLMPDMFHATDTSDQADIFLTDVDPYVVNNLMISRSGPAEQFKDKMQSDYILRVADLIWDYWCKDHEEERESVTRSFVKGIRELLPENIGLSATFLAFNEIHFRGQGLRNRTETRQRYLHA